MADVYYVGPQGSDSYTATQAHNVATPWTTLTRASSGLQPGDTVDVLPGKYVANSWKITVNGTAGKPIFFIGNGGKAPAPLLTASEWSALDIVRSSYLVVKNLEVTSSDTDPDTCSYGISLYSHSNHIAIENCRIHDCGGGGIGTTNQGGGGCDYITIRDNTVFDNAWYSKYEESGISLWEQSNQNPGDAGVHNLIEGNVCYGNSNKFVPDAKHTDGEGIIIDCGYTHASQQGGTDTSAATTLVSHNICYENGGSGIECYLDDDVVFDHNSCYENAQDPSYSGGGEIFVNGSGWCRVKDNICYSTGADGDNCIKLDSDGGTTTVTENCFWNAFQVPAASGPGYFFADPEFKNITLPNPDFRVKASGPADTPSGTLGAQGRY